MKRSDPTVLPQAAPSGGIKSSGLGREGARYGIEDFVEIKFVCLRGTQ